MKIFSPAKINLFLQVSGKRPDGYHNLFSLMCFIGLYDIVSLEVGGQGISITCNVPEVPLDQNNLAWKAVDLFFNHPDKKICVEKKGVRIDIKKKIPVAAGLGGGSSNAASVLLGLNQYFGYPYTLDKLMELGVHMGADIPFFIFGQPALATGIGEKLERFDGLKSMPILVVNPGIHISTSDVYKKLDLGLTKCEKKLKRFLLRKQAFNPEKHLCNDLETVTLPRHPEISYIKKALFEKGATGALMSGSGPTVFGVFPNYHGAEKAKEAIKRDKEWWIFLTELVVDTGCGIQSDSI